MVTGASTADLAVILIDARKGVLTQTRRHSIWPIWSGSEDRPGGDQDGPDRLRPGPLRRIVADYRTFAASIGIADFIAIPISGLKGDNIISASRRPPGMTDRR
jgi:bifunctional enzyme CysN/CysC